MSLFKWTFSSSVGPSFAGEDDSDRWIDHTTVTPFEEFIAKLERAIELLEGEADKYSQLGEIFTQLPLSRARLGWIRNKNAMTDFLQNDARASYVSRYFGVDSPYLVLVDADIGDRAAAQRLLSGLSVATCNVGSALPGFVAYRDHTPSYIGYSPILGVYYESDVKSTGWSTLKLEDFQRIYRAVYQSAQQAAPTSTIVSTKISTRYTWSVQLHPPSLSSPSPLLTGLRCSAVFPFVPEGALFDNQLFSTIDAERSPHWTVLCVWNCCRPPVSVNPGSGSYESGREFSNVLAPLSTGLNTLVEWRKQSTSSSANGENSQTASTVMNHELVQSLARRMRTSRLRLDQIANELAMDAFGSSDFPLTRLVVSLIEWLGRVYFSNHSHFFDSGEGTTPVIDEEWRVVLEAVWTSFCVQLRSKFEQRDESLFINCREEDIQPDLARTRMHQKVALIIFCTKTLYEEEGIDNVETEQTNIVDTGRKRELDFFLSNFPDRKAWEPITQSMSAWANHEDDGVSELHGSVRAALLSPSLIADMRAFKAANPGCEFVDFLKWFSPKDVTDTGDISARMCEEDGIWLQAWKNSTPQRAVEQKRVFDPIVVGEKALHWIEGQSIAQIIPFLLDECVHGIQSFAKMFIHDHLPMLYSEGQHSNNSVHRTTEKQSAHTGTEEPSAPSSITFSKSLKGYSQQLQVLYDAHDELTVLRIFPELEAWMSRIAAIRSSDFPAMLVDLLIAGDGTCVISTEANQVLVDYLLTRISNDRGDLTSPDKKEYLIVSSDSQKHDRLYASTAINEVRVARVLKW